MKVLLPSNISHTITIEPRFFTSETLTLYAYNESTRTSSEQVVLYDVTNGVMTVNFDLEVSEGDKYSFKILEDDVVVYRCKAFATEQEPQDYKLTDNKYRFPNV